MLRAIVSIGPHMHTETISHFNQTTLMRSGSFLFLFYLHLSCCLSVGDNCFQVREPGQAQLSLKHLLDVSIHLTDALIYMVSQYFDKVLEVNI